MTCCQSGRKDTPLSPLCSTFIFIQCILSHTVIHDGKRQVAFYQSNLALTTLNMSTHHTTIKKPHCCKFTQRARNPESAAITDWVSFVKLQQQMLKLSAADCTDWSLTDMTAWICKLPPPPPPPPASLIFIWMKQTRWGSSTEMIELSSAGICKWGNVKPCFHIADQIQ